MQCDMKTWISCACHIDIQADFLTDDTDVLADSVAIPAHIITEYPGCVGAGVQRSSQCHDGACLAGSLTADKSGHLALLRVERDMACGND